jgi:hypothetical protein
MNPQIKRAVKILKQNTQTELDLMNRRKYLLFLYLFSGIGNEGVKTLAEYLKSNSSLQILKLASKFKILNEGVLIFTVNVIGAEGATVLSKYLKSNTSLQRLNLDSKSNKNFK